MFIGIDRSRLTVTSASSTLGLVADELSLGGKQITEVLGIQGVGGKWSVDSDGNLVVDSIRARKGVFEESIEVGSDTKQTGITIYDTVTGQPYCLTLANAIMNTAPGKCTPVVSNSGSVTINPPTSGTSTTADPQSGSGTTTPPTSGTTTPIVNATSTNVTTNQTPPTSS